MEDVRSKVGGETLVIPCGCFSAPTTNSLWTPAGCLTGQLNSDMNCREVSPTWQVKASVPRQMPVTSRGSPGYPHFCVTWLQIGGVCDPLLGCDGFLWNAEMIRLITVEHQAPWNIHSIRLCALRLFAGLTFSLSYSVLHTVLMIISSSVRFQTHFSVLMPQQFCEAGSSYRSYFTV